MNNLSNIKLLVMDVDGTLTDGKIYIGVSGEVFKAFNVKDGYALVQCEKYGITTAIITGKTSDIVSVRAKELKIAEVFQGVKDKQSVLQEILDRHSYKWDEVAYIGDDENDLCCIEKCGFSACPADSLDCVISVVDYVCRRKGGDGAVRELLDKIFACKRNV